MTEGADLRLFGVTAPGLEPIAARELERLGIRGEIEKGGVAWTGDLASLFAANLHLRTASRVLVRVAEFRARTFYELERHARKIPWGRFVAPDAVVRFRTTARKSRLYHQRAIEQRLAEAVLAARPTARIESIAGRGDEEDDSGEGNAQIFVVRFAYDRCTLSADSSGVNLYQRGYRQALARAPLRETLAAAMLLESGWPVEAPLLDPFCGSGTIPIEAALLALGVPPGLAGADREPRAYAFTRWQDHRPNTWARVVEQARAGIEPGVRLTISGADRDEGAIAAAMANAERAGVADRIHFERRPLSSTPADSGAGWLVTNPPYGVRVGDANRLRDLYAALGRLLRGKLPDWRVTLLSADRALERQIGIPLEERVRTRNGGIAVRILTGALPPGAGDSDPHP